MTLRASPILALMLLGACKPQGVKHPAQAVAPDACNWVMLSKSALSKATDDAERGSIEAQRKLWDHYLCVDNRKAAYWRDRLIEANDAEALFSRSSALNLAASRLSDSDLRKLALLRLAQSDEERGRKTRGNGVWNVFINGKEVAVPYSSAPDEYTKRLADEIARLSDRSSK